MRTSSTAKLEFGLNESASKNDREIDSYSGKRTGDSGATSTGNLEFPDFNRFGQAYAVTSKLAGRVNASAVSEFEHRTLLKQRQLLISKKFESKLSRREENRLEYIRWSLDRIEDAKSGQTLDLIDNLVQRYEQFLDEIRSLERQLSEFKAK